MPKHTVENELHGADTNVGRDILDILDALPFYVLLIDEHHYILHANKAVQAHTGLEPKDVVSQYCPKVIHGVDEPDGVVPALLYQNDWAGMVKELLDSLSGKKRDWREEIAISMACHSAVRGGQALTDDEMRELTRQLEQAALPHTCPHGRPTMIRLSSAQLRKEFGRS